MQYFYDLESYSNLFTGCFLGEDDSRHTFVIPGQGLSRPNDRLSLIKFLQQPDLELVGFNSKHYDDLLLACVMEYKNANITADVLNRLSQLIINGNRNVENHKQQAKIRGLKYRKNEWQSVDLLQIVGGHRSGASLKKSAIHLRHNKLQDLPIPFNHTIRNEQVDEIIAYNWNDVLITKKMYDSIKPAVDLRRGLNKQYGIQVLDASESAIGNAIYNRLYQGKGKKGKTPRGVIGGGNLIPKRIKFETDEMKELLKTIQGLVLKPNSNKRYSYKLSLTFDKITYRLGVGGLHSEDEPGRWFSDVRNIVRDADVASYYPALVIEERLIPEHLDDSWLVLYTQLRDERIEAKKAGDKAKSDGLKITLNGTFGKMNSPYFWLYDPLQFLRVTIGGQLYLLDLIEKLYLEGIHTISANTDGIICYFDVSKEETYNRVCQAWEERTRFELEFTDYQQYTRLNVNSYIGVTIEEKVKTKGDFHYATPETDGVWAFAKGYSAPIVTKALQTYFTDGIRPEDFIPNQTNVHDYLYSKGGDKTYLVAVGKHGETRLQKTNRYYVTTDNVNGVYLYAVGKGRSAVLKDSRVKIANDIDEGRVYDDISFNFYIAETNKLITKVLAGEKQNKQLSLALV